MGVCALCGAGVAIDRYFSRKSACGRCGGDLRICLNCEFHSPSSHNQCRESQAEFQRVRDRATDCDHFRFGSGGTARTGKRSGPASDPARSDSAEEARRKLKDLFKG